jgi:cobalt-zinc-cadmium efflux system protein
MQVLLVSYDHDPAGPDHDRGAGHAGHSHGVSADADRGKLTIALALILAFMVFEVVVGAIVHSLALLSDAAHMLTDAGAVALSLVAIRLAAKPAKGAMTFGFKRAEILSAQFNGATLLVLGLLIVCEGIRRLIDPPEVGGTAVLVVALAGVVVNLIATYTLSKANRQSMSVEGAFQHILTDLAAFIFTAVAGAVILITGFARADGIASPFVAAIMLYAAYGLLKSSGRVFLEAAPEGVDVDAIGRTLARNRASPRCTTCMCGRSPPAFPRCPRTCSSVPTSTATPSVATSNASSTTAFTSSTRRCRSTMRAASC